MKADLKQRFKELTKEGWTITRGTKHYKLRSPKGHLVVASGSSSDQNYIHVLNRHIKRISKLEGV